MFLLDTNVVSELRKIARGRADPNVARWAASVDFDALYLSVVTILEIEIGIRHLSRSDTIQSDLLRDWLQGQVLPGFGPRILPVDVEIVRFAAALNVPDLRPTRDSLIAATAGVRGLGIVTRNVGDFVGCGPRTINPWSESVI